MLGKLLDGHDVGVLRDGESILLLGLHEFQVLWVRVLPSFFAWLMRDFAWLISRRFAFTLRITML